MTQLPTELYVAQMLASTETGLNKDTYAKFHCPMKIVLTLFTCCKVVSVNHDQLMAKENFTLCKCKFINALNCGHTLISKFALERSSVKTDTLTKRPFTDPTRLAVKNIQM